MQTQKRTEQDTGIEDKITGKNQGKDMQDKTRTKQGKTKQYYYE